MIPESARKILKRGRQKKGGTLNVFLGYAGKNQQETIF